MVTLGAQRPVDGRSRRELRWRRAVVTGVAAGVLIGIVAGGTRPVRATHESSQECFNWTSEVHGHDGDQAIDDRADNSLSAVMAAGRDVVLGGNFTDRLCGQSDPDVLRGQYHNDYMRGGQGADELYGGEYDDVLNGGDGVNDYCDGGPGNDEFDACECGPNNPC